MSRPATKADLLAKSATEYSELEKWMAGLTLEQMIQPGVLGPWSVKDTLAHLHEWHCMVLKWYAAGLRGEIPPVPAPGFTWRQIPALNQQIYEKYRECSLDEILAKFRSSHQKTQELISSLTEPELFTSGRFLWMNDNNLAAYLTSVGSSHYRWARTELRKGIKKLINS
jgi:hypothetical protein